MCTSCMQSFGVKFTKNLVHGQTISELVTLLSISGIFCTKDDVKLTIMCKLCVELAFSVLSLLAFG